MLNEINLSRIDLNLLVLFEAVFQEAHVGKAAIRLNLTASAVSHGLNRLRLVLDDPLFLRTPKGVSPTARALELASPIADVLAGVRSIIATATPFDPATSQRRFVIGAPDAIASVVVPPLLAHLGAHAPGIAISIRQLLVTQAEVMPAEQAWMTAFRELDARTIDIAIIPTDVAPVRFVAQHLFDEDFVIAIRAGHPFQTEPTLDAYCAAQHLVVSATGDPYGIVDRALARIGRVRRAALTVPNFAFALAIVADTDFVCALPRRFVERNAPRFGVAAVDAPFELENFGVHALMPHAATMDAGLAWLFNLVGQLR
jgi:DNA-binding transcriptional LysR family regulator